MTKEEKKLKHKWLMEVFELGSNPRNKDSHVCCCRCHKELYAPIPDYENKWLYEKYCISFTELMNEFLIDRGWNIIKASNEFICAKCKKEDDELIKSSNSNKIHEAVVNYNKWREEMRKKFNYYE